MDGEYQAVPTLPRRDDVSESMGPDKILKRGRGQRIFYLMFRAGLTVKSILEETGKGEGVTLSQYTVLALIAGRKEVTTADLARRLEISPQSVNEMIRTLASAGFIEKVASEKDKRLQLLHLTQAGKAQLERAERAMDKAEEVALRHLSASERGSFAAMLASILPDDR